MSVWRDAESLEHFVWNTVHKQFYRKRDEWFSLMDKQHFVMWWVDEGHVPTLEEAKARLESSATQTATAISLSAGRTCRM